MSNNQFLPLSKEARACIDMCLQATGRVWNNGPEDTIAAAANHAEAMAIKAYARAGEFYIEYLMEEGVVIQDEHNPCLFHLVDFKPLNIDDL